MVFTFISGLTAWLPVVSIFIYLPVSGAIVGFNSTCDGSTLVCDTTKSLECVATTGTTKQCKCMSGLFHYNGTCSNNTISKFQVDRPAAHVISQIEIVVAFGLLPWFQSLDRIEVSTTPVTQIVTVPLDKPFSNHVSLTRLRHGTTYIITITSIDTTSRVTAQSTSVTVNATTRSLSNFNGRCYSPGMECNTTKNLECNHAWALCKCRSTHYEYRGLCYRTSAIVGFNSTCDGSTLVCDTTKSLECVTTTGTTKQCKCTSGLFHYNGTCSNNTIPKLQVHRPAAHVISQIEIVVTFGLLPWFQSLDRIEVSTTPVTKIVTVPLDKPFSNEVWLTGLRHGTSYTITITSIDTTSRVTAQSTFVTVNATTRSLSNFHERCYPPLMACNATKNLECNTRGWCQCISYLYEYKGFCYQTIEKTLVRNATVFPTNTTSFQVTWNLPEHAASVNVIRIRTYPRNNQPWIDISNITAVSSAVVSGLQPGTEYSVLITSIDYTSRYSMGGDMRSVTVNATTFAEYDGACSDAVVCFSSINLECISDICKCKPRHYHYNGSCNTLSELKVINVEVTELGTTSVLITWKNPAANDVIENKMITWTRTSTGTTESKDLVSNTTSTDITGLTPGGTYNISVVSVDTDSRTSSQEIQSDNVVTTIKPALPGEIKTNIPYASGSAVHLSWISSVGVVSYYRVVFEYENGDARIQLTSTNSITMTSLTPSSSYNVTITAVSGTMTSDPRYGNARTTAAETTSLFTGPVGGSTVTVAVIILVVIVIVIIIWRRKNKKRDNYDDLQMGPYVIQGRVIGEDEPYTSLAKENKINRYRSLNVSNIYQVVTEMHQNGNFEFVKEFRDLEILSPKEQCKTASLQINRRKNRDESILPFDRTRVKFTEDKKKYINASYLQNYKNKLSQDFIVTQHPLSNTIEDFWTMVWEQNVSVIIMLTPKEDPQMSFETYFSSEPQSSKQYGSINVETMTKCFIQSTEFSNIKLKQGKKSRIIKHFQSLGWNDVNDQTMQAEIIHLIENVKSNVTPSDNLGPTVVHCGLGTGRSGVYIALYQLMGCILDNSVDIFGLVLTMRESRMKLVEYEWQYIFIHDCFLHMVNEKKRKQSVSAEQATGDTYECISDYLHLQEQTD